MTNSQSHLLQEAPLTEQGQDLVNSYFDKHALYWSEIYDKHGVAESIHQRRMQMVLEYVKAIAAPENSRLLDAGCGAGLLSAVLARNGYSIDAIDSSDAMVDMAQQRAIRENLEPRLRVGRGDVHSLHFHDDSFDVVLAIGVLPWIPSVDRALAEMSRITRPGGHIIVTVDYRWALIRLIDPLRWPFLRPLRRATWKALESALRLEPRTQSNVHSIREIRRILNKNGFRLIETRTLGFGPMRFAGYPILREGFGTKLHEALQSLAEKDIPLIRSTGAQSLMVAVKGSGAPQGRSENRPGDPGSGLRWHARPREGRARL
jgi:ubiquinone/menaquinone biosynthesis C-methylase UbiE